MSKMASFLLTESETELMNRSTEDILEEVAHWFNFEKKETQANATVSDREDRRLAHSRMLFAEGVRLSHTHPTEGQKLMMASIYWRNTEALQILQPEERMKLQRRVNQLEEEERLRKSRQGQMLLTMFKIQKAYMK